MENKSYSSNHGSAPHAHGGPGMRRGSGEKAKDFTGTWKKLIKYCKRYIVPVLIAVICAIGGTVFTLVGPDRLSDMTEEITKGLTGTIDLEAVGRIGFTLVAFYLCSIVLSFIQHFIMTTISQMVSQQMRSDITRKINRLPMSFYSHSSHGDILSRVTNDVDMISMSLNQSVGMLVSAITLFIGSLFMMLITNVIMTLTAVVAIFIGFMLMRLITSHSQKYFARQQRHLGELNGHIEEIYSGHTVVKAYNDEANAKRTFDEMNGNLRESAFRAQCLAGLMQPLMVFIGNLGYVAVCVVGAVLTMNGQIGFEVIVAFMMYVRFFTQPLSQIAQAIQSLQSGAAAGERVFEFLEAKEMEDEKDKTAHLENTKGYVEFDHVKFGYDPDKIIIHDFSAKAKPGQKIAIVGPTGAGKTTLVNLLMRFYEIDGGDIRIDGISTKTMNREEVHSQFCMVLQDTWLFEGTVRENLIYCSENVSDEKMEAACKAVGLDHFIHTLPHGYDTILNDQLNLSQGQKQQLTIARAMIADKPMLILDEATSSVDTRTELQIQNAMDALMEGRTSFVIAHRLSTIKNSDLILVLKDGDVIESGTHDELLEKGGFYADLYNSQFDKAS
ncbi:ATP-binding cassette subfamily B protein [Catenibacillus scindens]|uniref:ATP-binding cassette subfamily B protein n=1 Tax=Catenibacillus scindens TaxID=673271 RepID=A0A7W8H8D2_9FIRM|nr:ABC transporter ATP-binding protein [Catenibacillus scindens]MBB5263766.1 ATP-binding cassette subfamily B protein [Catenibacillus scindens]